jgi:hypothetical protein
VIEWSLLISEAAGGKKTCGFFIYTNAYDNRTQTEHNKERGAGCA